MNVTADNLSRLNADFSDYLEGERVDLFFQTYGINFSAGHWCAGGFSDRFCATYSRNAAGRNGDWADFSRGGSRNRGRGTQQ